MISVRKRYGNIKLNIKSNIYNKKIMFSNHPGPWQQYQFRPDNKGLSVMEMKSKYLHEQYLFETELLNLQQQ